MGRLGRKKKRAREARWEGEREKKGSRLFPLPIVPACFLFFDYLLFLLGLPAETSAEEEERGTTLQRRLRRGKPSLRLILRLVFTIAGLIVLISYEKKQPFI